VIIILCVVVSVLSSGVSLLRKIENIPYFPFDVAGVFVVQVIVASVLVTFASFALENVTGTFTIGVGVGVGAEVGVAVG
jgi:hypothetical protein